MRDFSKKPLDRFDIANAVQWYHLTGRECLINEYCTTLYHPLANIIGLDTDLVNDFIYLVDLCLKKDYSFEDCIKGNFDCIDFIYQEFY